MKNLLALFAGSALSLLIGGCTTPSLNGLATPETVVTDPDLVGRWVEMNKSDATYVISQGGENDYKLTVIPKDGKKPQEYAFEIVKLSDTRFIDLTMTRGAIDEISDKYGSLVVPTHLFMKIKRKGDSLTIWDIKNDWLNDGLKSGEVKLAHATVGGEPADNSKANYILTGSTSELQYFFRTNAENEDAFDKPVTMRRDTGEEEKAPNTKQLGK